MSKLVFQDSIYQYHSAYQNHNYPFENPFDDKQNNSKFNIYEAPESGDIGAQPEEIPISGYEYILFIIVIVIVIMKKNMFHQS